MGLKTLDKVLVGAFGVGWLVVWLLNRRSSGSASVAVLDNRSEEYQYPDDSTASLIPSAFL